MSSLKFVCNRLVPQKFQKMIIKAALIDLSGTLHIEDSPTPNAVEGLRRLREKNIHIKFVTNTTKESRKTLHKRLRKIGFELEANEIFSSLTAAANYVKNEGLNPFFLLSEDARSEFDFVDDSRELDSVVVGLAPREFHYENLNKAFNLLIANKTNRLVAIHQGKYYKRNDGLALGPGAFIKGLEYAASTSSVLIGKPNEYFFQNAIPEGVYPEECVMIGDLACSTRNTVRRHQQQNTKQQKQKRKRSSRTYSGKSNQAAIGMAK
ncbi:haloacid dehalogenase-like hydrolase domain-containing protein 2 isoform X3 [Eurosta solidaginis]|uniref:haloacid dehalogenase-like hydrolase domain-containing protein 2 isoform X3 n=1 Tax=Eurosta solidaginis TaxID=178769 RepID=UPI00353168AB